jgi:predicted enzyme related to lactoylglutathione lyase
MPVFYSLLFDWKLRDVLMLDRYTNTMIDVGKGTGGGITFKPIFVRAAL